MSTVVVPCALEGGLLGLANPRAHQDLRVGVQVRGDVDVDPHGSLGLSLRPRNLFPARDQALRHAVGFGDDSIPQHTREQSLGLNQRRLAPRQHDALWAMLWNRVMGRPTPTQDRRTPHP